MPVATASPDSTTVRRTRGNVTRGTAGVNGVMPLQTYLNYGSNREQAFRFYAQHPGGVASMQEMPGGLEGELVEPKKASA